MYERTTVLAAVTGGRAVAGAVVGVDEPEAVGGAAAGTAGKGTDGVDALPRPAGGGADVSNLVPCCPGREASSLRIDSSQVCFTCHVVLSYRGRG